MNHFKNKIQDMRGFTVIIKSVMLFLFFFTTNSLLHAQEKTIPVVKGTVKNDADEVLGGATVTIVGTKIFTTSKKDGTFELKNVPEGASLRISYVGHTATEVKLKAGQTDVSVKMSASSNVLSEVVVNNGLYKRPAGNFT